MDPILIKVAASALFVTIVGSAPGATKSITESQILISLPVFVASISATAVLAWSVAKFENKRARRFEDVERTNIRIEKKLDRLLKKEKTP